MKTYVRRKNRDKRVIEFDHFIPYNSKPRSDLSVSLSPPSISKGSKEKSSTLIESTLDTKIDPNAGVLNLPLAQWARSRNKRKTVSLDTSTQKVGSIAKLEPVLSQSQSNFPGSVVWAKKASQMWWPATCFEEKSCNPLEEFQEALKQAIHQKEHQSSTRKLIAPTEGHVCLNSKNSSKTEHDCLVKGRSKRQRKPKVHFDEVNVPSKSAKDSRRLRIMRSLGLAPPIGSPFAQSPVQE